jgi:hypothetical protein
MNDMEHLNDEPASEQEIADVAAELAQDAIRDLA